MYRRSAGRGDHADPGWPAGQGAFTFGCKQTLLFQPQAQRLKSTPQCAFAGVFQLLDNELVLTAGFVQADPCPDQNMLTVAEGCAELACPIAKQCTTHLRLLIFQGKIQMS